MAINYLKMRATSKRLLTENGMQYRGERPGGVVRVDGEEVIIPPEALTITGVQTDYQPREIDGKNIMSGDKQIIATADTEVKTGDFFSIDGQRWRVVNPHPVKPAMLVICYKIQLRGA